MLLEESVEAMRAAPRTTPAWWAPSSGFAVQKSLKVLLRYISQIIRIRQIRKSLQANLFKRQTCSSPSSWWKIWYPSGKELWRRLLPWWIFLRPIWSFCTLLLIPHPFLSFFTGLLCAYKNKLISIVFGVYDVYFSLKKHHMCSQATCLKILPPGELWEGHTLPLFCSQVCPKFKIQRRIAKIVQSKHLDR